MSAEGRVVPPSVGDVLRAGEAYGWPEIVLDGERVLGAGEHSWRAAMTPELAASIWAAWQDGEDP